MSELDKNIFSQFYTDGYIKKKNDDLSIVQEELQRYTHQDAIDFAEHNKLSSAPSKLRPLLPRVKFLSSLKFASEVSGIRAYYRVVQETPNAYILAACHVNIHGHHRGDLRFIEINDRTVIVGSEDCSILGHLFLGDIIVVGILARIQETEPHDVFKSNQEELTWMAVEIVVLQRKIREKCTISMLGSGDVVVKGSNDLMKIQESSGLKKLMEPGKLYFADAFIPEKIKRYFCSNHLPAHTNRLVLLSSKIHQPTTPLGTIFKVYTSEKLDEIFQIGLEAFSKPSAHRNSPDEILETCVLMGYTAATAMSFGRLDTRSFPIKNFKRNGRFLEFSIDNPFKNPTEGKWEAGNRIVVDGRTGKDEAVIETVISETHPYRNLKITARLSKDVPHFIRFNKGVHIVYQKEPWDILNLKDGFYKQLPDGSNARSIIQALYGGPKIPKLPTIGKSFYYGQVKLNPFQAEYVELMMDYRNPIIIGSSPFGCGKSMTIVTAAMEIAKANPAKKQILVTQSNFASVNLVEIAAKCSENKWEKPRMMRYISEKNTKQVAEDCLTDFDLPKLQEKIFSGWAMSDSNSAGLSDKHVYNILNFLLNNHFVEPHQLTGHSLQMYSSLKKSQFPSTFYLLDAFFTLYDPDVIMTTADSLHSLLSYNVLKKHQVCTVQIDEASQLPEHTFFSLLTMFPSANYGLIGDIQQLPPFCETGLDGKLKDYGIGNTMERAVKNYLFPQAMLRKVYRCHPRTTEILSKLFYSGKLIPGIMESQRNQFMTRRPDFWPNPKFPVMIINNQEKRQRMGTSSSNKSEKKLVLNLLEQLTTSHQSYKLQESEIGVISFYKAQTSVLTDALRGKNIKCGTVDSFQGSEREVIILCCTNEMISDFMQLGHRLNVAMSRAKQATIIIGNLEGLRKAEYWKEVVREAEMNGCVVEVNSIGSLRSTTAMLSQNTTKQKNHNHYANWSDLDDWVSEEEEDDLDDMMENLMISVRW